MDDVHEAFMEKSMLGKTYGARMLSIIRRTAPEDAVPVEFGGVISPEHRGLFDRACLRAAREAMREVRFQEQVNGVVYKRDPVGAMMLRDRVLKEAIEARNLYCKCNLGSSDANA